MFEDIEADTEGNITDEYESEEDKESDLEVLSAFRGPLGEIYPESSSSEEGDQKVFIPRVKL